MLSMCKSIDFITTTCKLLGLCSNHSPNSTLRLFENCLEVTYIQMYYYQFTLTQNT